MIKKITNEYSLQDKGNEFLNHVFALTYEEIAKHESFKAFYCSGSFCDYSYESCVMSDLNERKDMAAELSEFGGLKSFEEDYSGIDVFVTSIKDFFRVKEKLDYFCYSRRTQAYYGLHAVSFDEKPHIHIFYMHVYKGAVKNELSAYLSKRQPDAEKFFDEHRAAMRRLLERAL